MTGSVLEGVKSSSCPIANGFQDCGNRQKEKGVGARLLALNTIGFLCFGPTNLTPCTVLVTQTSSLEQTERVRQSPRFAVAPQINTGRDAKQPGWSAPCVAGSFNLVEKPVVGPHTVPKAYFGGSNWPEVIALTSPAPV